MKVGCIVMRSKGVRCRLQWRAMRAMFVDESRMDSDEVEGD